MSPGATREWFQGGAGKLSGLSYIALVSRCVSSGTSGGELSESYSSGC